MHTEKPIFTAQFHPEAFGGPTDTEVNMHYHQDQHALSPLKAEHYHQDEHALSPLIAELSRAKHVQWGTMGKKMW